MAKLKIIFVHGLGGAATSWGSFKELIAADPELSSLVSPYFYVFPTGIIKLFDRWRSVELQELADGLATNLDNRFPDSDRILLVGHSMGGLICKAYLAKKIGNNEAHKVKGVIFFATPHLGSELASASALLSQEHAHARQIIPNSSFLESLNRDWTNHRCEADLDTTYVAGGQDSVVPKSSASGPPTSRGEFIPDVGHISIVKPNDKDALSFLILKNAVKRLLRDENEDMTIVADAIQARDTHTVESIVASKGRSWIETHSADRGISLLEKIIATFDAASAEVIWSRYLLIIARLFKYKDTSSSAIDDDLILKSERFNLDSLFVAEKMELARKRGEPTEALSISEELERRLEKVSTPRSAGEAYAMGTANFLLGNLFRFGGQYQRAQVHIEKAQRFYRPAILAHQIELAHCEYALEVCRAVTGSLREEKALSLSAPELRLFSESLLTLSQSHTEWSLGRTSEASDFAAFASQGFAKIGFVHYARRSERLCNLLKVWRQLEHGEVIESAVSNAPDDASILRAMLGQPDAIGTIRDGFAKMRCSNAVGLLQFAAAFNPDWTKDVGQFNLPSVVISNGNQLSWKPVSATTLELGNALLRANMGIASTVRVPLLAD